MYYILRFLFQGSILAKGSYQQLQASDFDFKKLLLFSEDTTFDCKNEQIENKKNVKTSSILSTYGSNDSIKSLINKFNLDETLKQPIQDTEIRSFGHVSKNVYMAYVSAGGSTCKIGLLLFVYFLCQILITGGDYWISFW